MPETYHYEPTAHSELRQYYDEKGDDIDEIDHEEEDEGSPELDNQQML